MPPTEVNDAVDPLDTQDFRAFSATRDAEAPPVAEEVEVEASAVDEEETPPSEPADKEADQTAAESEPEEEEEQEEDEPQDELPVRGKPQMGLAKRMRTMTGEIKTLKSRLAELTSADAEVEAEEEVVSSPALSAEPAAEADLAAPLLRDFEDDEASGQSAWDQYEAATKAFNKAETAKAIKAALAEQKTVLEREHAAKAEVEAKQTADAAWNKSASRFPNYNEVVRAEVQISTAMEAVMRMDPDSGTELAMWLGEHPEESKALALKTLANNEKEWGTALARAGVELGMIRAKMTPRGKAVAPSAKLGSAPALTPPTKKVSTASKPPTIIRAGIAAPKFDLTSEDDAKDFGKWSKAREKQVADSGKR